MLSIGVKGKIRNNTELMAIPLGSNGSSLNLQSNLLSNVMGKYEIDLSTSA